jgi:hypothetical protein
MFIFLNLTFHSFGFENFVPLVKIGKFQKGLTEKNGSYEMMIIYSQRANFWGKKSSKIKPARTYAPAQYI